MFDNVDNNSTVTGFKPLFNPVPIYNGSDTDEHLPISTAPICLQYKVSPDKDLRRVVDSGKVFTSSDVDYTVKVCCPSDIFEDTLNDIKIFELGGSSQIETLHLILLPV